MKKYLDRLEIELKLRGFSKRTIDTYFINVKLFLNQLNKDAEETTEDDIKLYFAEIIANRQLSPRSIAVKKASLKFFYEEVLDKKIINLKTPKIPKSIPIFLTRDELKQLFAASSSKKSLLIMKLLYSTGLRVSECVNLKVSDLELEEGVGWVRKGKSFLFPPLPLGNPTFSLVLLSFSLFSLFSLVFPPLAPSQDSQEALSLPFPSSAPRKPYFFLGFA